MSGQEPTINIRKIGYTMPVSQELIDQYDKPFTETAEERGERIAKTNRQWALFDAAVPALAAITDPASRAILDLHAPSEHNQCQGCDMDGYEVEMPEWPCRSTQAIAEVHGITLPDWIPATRPRIGPDPEPRSFRSLMNEALMAPLSFDFRPLDEEIQ